MQTLKTTSLKVKEHADAKEISRNCYGILLGGKKYTHTQTHIYKSESRSIMSDSLRPHGLYSWWNSPGQNTGVGSLFLLQGSSQPRDQSQVSRMAGRFFTSLATREATREQFTESELLTHILIENRKEWIARCWLCSWVLFQERINDY